MSSKKDLSMIVMAEPWEQMHGEGDAAYCAFVSFMNIPPVVRTLQKLCEDTGKSRSLIGRYSAQYNWIERAMAHDAKIQEMADAELAAKIVPTKNLHLQISQLSLEKAMIAIHTIDPEELTPSEAIKLADYAVRVARLTLNIQECKTVTIKKAKSADEILLEIASLTEDESLTEVG